MIIENTIDFIRTGQLINFPYGIEKRKVITLLGETEERIDNKESSMLKYDRTEFYFYHHESGIKYLTGIVIQPIPIPANKGNLKMDYSWLTKKLKFSNAKNQLKLEHIEFNEIIDRDNDSLVLRTEGKVELLFFRDDNLICKVGRYIDFEELERLINGG